MIQLARERNELYYLETPSKSSIYFLFEHHFFNKEKIWLDHWRLGYLSFRTLKILFPSLFRKLDVDSFHCDVCELAKHKHSTFLTNNKRSSKPFHLIPSDIWGPSLYLIYLGHVGLCFSSMIVLGSFGSFYLNTNLMWVLFFQISITW